MVISKSQEGSRIKIHFSEFFTRESFNLCRFLTKTKKPNLSKGRKFIVPRALSPSPIPNLSLSFSLSHSNDQPKRLVSSLFSRPMSTPPVKGFNPLTKACTRESLF
ncbi:hypothetical protein J5N97_020030 [Dioscorea zingiberensis]|uniref:Uncharacterized protein n=1 Tax=Dioscorea zingiberensis TaxID=325984 RepID=A0A9D5CF43_9LILI|nr:hypothetical protein J5N97_020030 [Dioscorea zingiberensis]